MNKRKWLDKTLNSAIQQTSDLQKDVTLSLKENLKMEGHAIYKNIFHTPSHKVI